MESLLSLSCSYLVKTSRSPLSQRVNSLLQTLVPFHLLQVHVCDISIKVFWCLITTIFTLLYCYITFKIFAAVDAFLMKCFFVPVKFSVGTPPNVSTPWRRGSIGSSQGGAIYHPPSNASNSPSRRASKFLYHYPKYCVLLVCFLHCVECDSLLFI